MIHIPIGFTDLYEFHRLQPIIAMALIGRLCMITQLTTPKMINVVV